MLVDVGNTGIRNVLAGYVTQIGYGSSGTPVSPSDTGLQNQVLNAVTAVTNLPGGRIRFIAQVDDNDPAMTVLETGLFDANGTLLFRTLITPYNKVAGVSNSVYYILTLS